MELVPLLPRHLGLGHLPLELDLGPSHGRLRAVDAELVVAGLDHEERLVCLEEPTSHHRMAHLDDPPGHLWHHLHRHLGDDLAMSFDDDRNIGQAGRKHLHQRPRSGALHPRRRLAEGSQQFRSGETGEQYGDGEDDF